MTIVQNCARLLSDAVACELAMRKALDIFPISAEQHLTKPMGRNPWIGQAACCAELRATEEETRVAWNFYMTEDQKNAGNTIFLRYYAQLEQAN